VQFASALGCAAALQKDHQMLGHRYVEVYQSTLAEREKGRQRSMPWQPISMRSCVARLRGLPFSASEDDIRKFLVGVSVSGVHIVMDALGRNSGDAYVEVPSKEAERQVLAFNKRHMGTRYVEIFSSSIAEMTASIQLSGSNMPNRGRGGGPPPMGGLGGGGFGGGGSLRGPGSFNAGDMSGSCLRMQGLPYTCTESDITRFFQEVNVTPLRIHRKHNGGEAYVEFASPAETNLAMTKHKHNIGRRYIDLFRASQTELAEVVGLGRSAMGLGLANPAAGATPTVDYNALAAAYAGGFNPNNPGHQLAALALQQIQAQQLAQQLGLLGYGQNAGKQ